MSKSKKNKTATTGNINDMNNAGNIKLTPIVSQPLQPQANFANYSNLGKPFQDNVSLNSQSSQKFGTVKKNKKIDKSQISGPTGFRVVQHVGLTNNNNFEVLYCFFFYAFSFRASFLFFF
jgi:hypothetical protein